MLNPFEDEPTLARLELIGAIARACRLALMDNEHADTVEFTVRAGPEGVSVDCALSQGEVHLMGWGQ